MGAKHVLQPKSHQRSLSYALNTSKLGDETVAFKFYGRCKQGLLTSPGWSAPWSAGGCWWLAWWRWLWCVQSQGTGGRDITKRPGCVQNVFMQKAIFRVLGSDRVSWSRLDTGRRPLQGSLVSEDLSRVCLRPASVPFGNGYIGREERRGQSLMTKPQSDHNTPLTDQKQTL